MSTSFSLEYKKNQHDYEENFLSCYAAKSAETKGRKREEQSCEFRTEFQRDRDRILHSKAFRRLKHKTQVFFSPLGDHYRTRMTHTLEVSQIARTIARVLKLNEDLVEAIALGHDLGHTPFGHTGEAILDDLLIEGFKHNAQSIRVVSIIEDLNLTKETLDGILNHTGPNKPKTLEGQVVKIADRVAYLNHDIDDGIRAGILNLEDLPKESIEYFGEGKSQRVLKMVQEIVENSYNKDEVVMSNEGNAQLLKLRAWMFKNVYFNKKAKAEENTSADLIRTLFNHYYNEFSDMTNSMDEVALQRVTADYIAGMTDRYAIIKFQDLFVPSPMPIKENDDYLKKLARKNNLINE